jgi:hypothetical protein
MLPGAFAPLSRGLSIAFLGQIAIDKNGAIDMEIMTSIEIDGQQYFLKYPGLVQILIEKKAADFLGLGNRKPTLQQLFQIAAVDGSVEIQAYLLWQGIMGGMPELRRMKFEEAVELRDKYLQGSELDDGTRYKTFLETIGEAIDAAFGADRKKSLEKREEEAKAARIEELEKIYAAKIKAEEKAGTGKQPGEKPSES